MSSISGPVYARLLTVATGAINLGLFLLALLGLQYWGPRLALWALLVCLLWAAFIALPLWLLSLVLVAQEGRE